MAYDLATYSKRRAKHPRFHIIKESKVSPLGVILELLNSVVVSEFGLATPPFDLPLTFLKIDFQHVSTHFHARFV